MAGTMNVDCLAVRHELAERLLLQLPLRGAAVQHLDSCPECSRQAAEIRDVVRTLHRAASAAGVAVLGHGNGRERLAPVCDLGHRIRQDVSRAARTRVTRRRIAMSGAALMLAAAAAILVPGAVLDHAPARPLAAVALTREGQMVTQPWGTEVPVALVGLHPGQTYRLMTEDSSGRRMPGGSVRAAIGATLHTQIMTAMPRESIAALLVEDESGRVVGSMPVTPLPSPPSSSVPSPPSI
ncbi:hypothetical protein ACWC9T_22375 [Kitasatospora sp. NPDC001159]